jgi:hypothetical protein
LPCLASILRNYSSAPLVRLLLVLLASHPLHVSFLVRNHEYASDRPERSEIASIQQGTRGFVGLQIFQVREQAELRWDRAIHLFAEEAVTTTYNVAKHKTPNKVVIAHEARIDIQTM